jgi:hypothetical protein
MILEAVKAIKRFVQPIRPNRSAISESVARADRGGPGRSVHVLVIQDLKAACAGAITGWVLQRVSPELFNGRGVLVSILVQTNAKPVDTKTFDGPSSAVGGIPWPK